MLAIEKSLLICLFFTFAYYSEILHKILSKVTYLIIPLSKVQEIADVELREI